VTLTVLRENAAPNHAELQPLRLTLSWDDRWQDNVEVPIGMRSPLSISGLGLAYRIETMIAEVRDQSPAQAAGLKKDDVIKAIQFQSPGKTPNDEAKPDDWIDLQSDQWAHAFFFLQHKEAKTFKVRIEREKTEMTMTLAAEKDETWPMNDRGFLFMTDSRLHKAESLSEALVMGVNKTTNFINQIFGNLRGVGTGRLSPKNFVGPIGIFQFAFYYADNIYRFMIFLGIIGVNLAVVNFLPIPVLDGGHMVFLIYERLRGKPAPEMVRFAATMVGVTLILALMAFVIYLDVSRLKLW
jgi:regulator of sigma E protease